MSIKERYALSGARAKKMEESISGKEDDDRRATAAADLAAEKKKKDDDKAGEAALRARILPYVYECRQKGYDGGLLFPGQWCWSDPNGILNEEHSFPTKEEALINAMAVARYGLAFKK